MLPLLFLAATLLSALSCGKKLPLVTLNQLDITHNQVNPFKITKYNEVTCRLELTELESYPILKNDSPLNGGVCLTPEDYNKFKTFLETECQNNKPKVKDNVDRTLSPSRQ